MHSIEELKRQYDAARDRTRAAMDAEREAKKRYRDGLVEATGLKGCAVEYTATRGFGRSEKTVTYRFLVSQMGEYSSRSIRGPMIKADGTIGEMMKECAISEAHNLGPYTPPGAK